MLTKGSGGGINGGLPIFTNGDTAHIKYNQSATPSTQTSGGETHYNYGDKIFANSGFGYGGNSIRSGGGAGWYGGSAFVYTTGGSGFIGSSRLISYKNETKSMYCYECTTSSSTETRTYSTTNVSETPISKYAKIDNGYAKITPIIEPSKDNYLSELTVDRGELSPEFNPLTEEYELTVTSDIDEINVQGLKSDEKATVTGFGKHNLDVGTNEINIIVISESGDVRTYTIRVTKEEKEMIEIVLDENSIILGEEEEYQINASIMPESSQNKELIYESSDETIVSVNESGMLVGKNIGNAVITIKLKDNEEVEAKLIVKVMLKKIKSDVYSVEEKEEGQIIIGMDPGLTLEELKMSLLNAEETIKIYDKEDNHIIDYEDMVKNRTKNKISNR